MHCKCTADIGLPCQAFPQTTSWFLILYGDTGDKQISDHIFLSDFLLSPAILFHSSVDLERQGAINKETNESFVFGLTSAQVKN